MLCVSEYCFFWISVRIILITTEFWDTNGNRIQPDIQTCIATERYIMAAQLDYMQLFNRYETINSRFDKAYGVSGMTMDMATNDLRIEAVVMMDLLAIIKGIDKYSDLYESTYEIIERKLRALDGHIDSLERGVC